MSTARQISEHHFRSSATDFLELSAWRSDCWSSHDSGMDESEGGSANETFHVGCGRRYSGHRPRSGGFCTISEKRPGVWIVIWTILFRWANPSAIGSK